MRKGLLITMLLSLLLTGCGAAGWGDTNVEDTIKKETVVMFTSEKEVINSPEEGVQWYSAQAVGDTVYYLADESININGEAASGLYVKRPNEEPVCIVDLEYIFSTEFAVDDDGNIYTITYDRQHHMLQKYNAEGELLFEKAAEGSGRYLQGEGMIYTGEPAVSEAGFCIVSDKGVCLIWDSQGNAVGQVEADWYKDGMHMAYGDFGLVSGAEDIYVYHREDGSIFLQAVDFEAGTLKGAAEIQMPESESDVSITANRLYSAYEEGIYIADYDALYLYDDRSGELQEIFRWFEQGVNVEKDDIRAIGKDADGNMLFYEYNFLTGESARICIGEKEITRQLLTLGYIDDSFLYMGAEYVTEFNRTQDEILITLKAYEDVEALQQDLEAGTGPDLLELSRIDIAEYTERGILEGLNSYLEKSDRLNAEDILPSLLEEMTFQGEVRFLAPSFMIWSMLLGEEEAAADGMTVTEFLKLEPEEGGYICDRKEESLFGSLLGRDMEQYVDWQRRSCSFDDGRFAAFLEAVKAAELPDGTDSSSSYLHKDMSEGKYLAAFRGAGSIKDIKEMRKAMEDIALITGWPDSEGDLKYDVVFTSGELGINSASAGKAAAWEYLEYYLLEYAESSRRYSDPFSVLVDTFEKQLDPDVVKGVTYLYINSYTGKQERLIQQYSDADRELARSMVENVKMSRTTQYMGMIGTIIDEETDAFFSGEKSAEEVAGIIQEKVSAYMKE